MSTAAIFVAIASHAAPRTALVAAGRCDDADLLDQSRDLTRELSARMGDQLNQEDLMNRLPRSASRVPAELERQIEGAELQYFEANYSVAERRVLDSLEEVERLRPGSKRWQLFVRAVLLHALVLRATNRAAEADDQFKRVLRIHPDQRLDADYFSPSTRARFDRVRRQLASESRTTLAMTSTPSGAEVFIDGLGLKQTTPVSVDLPPGRYSVSLSAQGGFSFPRLIDLTSPSSLHVDLEFESSLDARVIPCFADGGDEQVRLTHALKLGSWLGIDQIVIARAERRSAGYVWLSAALMQVSTGQKVREGGLKVDSTGSPSLGELADFISSGKVSRNIVASDVAYVAPRESPNAEPILTSQVSAQLGPPTSQEARAKGWTKPVGTGLLGLGTVGIGLGMAFQLRSDQSWAALSRRYPDGRQPPISDVDSVQSTRARAASQHNSAILSYSIGAVAVSAGVLFLLKPWSTSSATPIVSIRLLPGAVSVDARWH
jgi:hypothetical protein